MPTSARKYRLEELVRELPRSVNIGTIERMLLEQYGITGLTFLRHRKIPLDSKSEMSAGTLRAYADFFSVTMDELLTPDDSPKHRPSVYELLNVHKRVKVSDVAALAGMSAPE